MKRTSIYILLCLFIAGSFVVPEYSARAQSGEWSYTYDFVNGMQGWTPATKEGIDHAAWGGNEFIPNMVGGLGSYPRRSVIIQKTFSPDIDINNIHIYTSSGNHEQYFYNLTDMDDDWLATVSSSAGDYAFSVDHSTGMVALGIDRSGAEVVDLDDSIIKVVLRGDGECPFDTCDEYQNNGTPGPPLPSQFCAILGTNNANFRDIHSWTFSGGAAYANTDPDYGLELPPGGSASINIPLSPSSKYRFQVSYEALQTGDNGNFTVKIGTNAAYSIPVQSHTSEQVYTQAAVAYSPNSGGNYTVTIARPSGITGDIAVNFFCIIRETDAPTDADPGDGGSVDDCEACDPPLGITDITGIINWIICNIRSMFNCWLLPALANWLGFLVALVRYFLGFVEWLLGLAEGAINFVAELIGAVAGWIGGVVNNLASSINNAFHTSGMASATNGIASGVRDLPTSIANGIAFFGGQISEIFLTSTSLVELVTRLIGLAAATVAYIIGLIPLVWQSLIDGINSSGAAVSGGPTCTTPGALMYWPCFGFYVMDNTIFSGPGRWLIPILMGLIGLDFITWLLHRIKEELTK